MPLVRGWYTGLGTRFARAVVEKVAVMEVGTSLQASEKYPPLMQQVGVAWAVQRCSATLLQGVAVAHWYLEQI